MTSSNNTRLKKSKLILFPAIDLKGGECVRLKLGDMDQATVYNTDPGAQAKAFEDQGFEWLHVVDLDGAFAGEAVNGDAVEAILAATKNPVQLGGGIRTLEHIEYWLNKGIARVILGTIAVRDPELVREACKKFPGKIAVGIDAKGGKVAVEGWAETSELTTIDMAARFEDAGVAAIIFTDIDRDGVLTGINWDSTLELARSTKTPVIASGGLASMNDIRRMTRDDAQVLEGAITGRALYDGRIDTKEALMVLQAEAKGFRKREDKRSKSIPEWVIFLGAAICIVISVWPLLMAMIVQKMALSAGCVMPSPKDAIACKAFGIEIGGLLSNSIFAGFVMPFYFVGGITALLVWLAVTLSINWKRRQP